MMMNDDGIARKDLRHFGSSCAFSFGWTGGGGVRGGHIVTSSGSRGVRFFLSFFSFLSL